MPKNFQTSQYDEPIASTASSTSRCDRRRAHVRSASRSSARTWRRTPARRCTSAAPPAASTAPTTRCVDYNRAGIPLIEIVTKPIEGTGALAPEVAKAYVTELRDLLRGARRLRRADGAGLAALRRQRVAAALARRPAGHPHRDQERQLAALGRAGGALRDAPAGRGARRRRPDRPGDAALPRGHRRHDLGPQQGGGRGLPLLPGARPRARSRPTAAWVEELRATLPEPPAVRRRRLQETWGLTDLEMAVGGQRRCARPGRGDRRRGRRRRRPPASGGLGELVPDRQRARRRARPSCRSRPREVARVEALVESGRAQRQARPPGGRRRARRRGRRRTRSSPLAVSPSSPTTARCSRRSTRRSPPSPTSPRRSAAARSQAVGALVGAVMKATRGQADAGPRPRAPPRAPRRLRLAAPPPRASAPSQVSRPRTLAQGHLAGSGRPRHGRCRGRPGSRS